MKWKETTFVDWRKYSVGDSEIVIECETLSRSEGTTDEFLKITTNMRTTHQWIITVKIILPKSQRWEIIIVHSYTWTSILIVVFIMVTIFRSF